MFFKRNYAIKANSKQQDYGRYKLSVKEWLKYGAAGMVVGSALLYFFYQSLYVLAAGVLCAYGFCSWQSRRLCEVRRKLLVQQFKDWIAAVISGLQAGYSVENAFKRAGDEIKLLYGEQTDIRREICHMEYLLENNVTLEQILLELGRRSHSEEIQNFAEVFAVGKRSGGDLRECISGCCEMIGMRLDTEREIDIVLHGKEMEQRIMCLVPFGIIAYISISSPGYFAPLYHNTAGILVMTLCLLFYAGAVWISIRIVRIEV